MNTRDDLKQLELATSHVPEENLDAETAELREGWRVLTAALEKNHGPLDEAALVARLQRELASSPPLAETNRRREGWIMGAILLGGALAASLLLVVGLAGIYYSQQPIAQPTNTIPLPPNNLAVAPGTNASPVVEIPSHGINENDGSLWNWDDPLDSQISVAAAQMQTFQKPALPLDASISTLNYQLQQMAQDLDEGAL